MILGAVLPKDPSIVRLEKRSVLFQTSKEKDTQSPLDRHSSSFPMDLLRDLSSTSPVDLLREAPLPYTQFFAWEIEEMVNAHATYRFLVHDTSQTLRLAVFLFYFLIYKAVGAKLSCRCVFRTQSTCTRII